MQRIFGNDILILKHKLNDERGFVGTYGVPLSMLAGLSALFFFNRRRFINMSAFSKVSSQSTEKPIATGVKLEV